MSKMDHVLAVPEQSIVVFNGYMIHNMKLLDVRGHSKTVWTNFCPILTTYLPIVDFCGHLVHYLPFVHVDIDFLAYLNLTINTFL